MRKYAYKNVLENYLTGASGMKKICLSSNVGETQNVVAEQVLKLTEESETNLVLLQGDLGAGKTTFAQGILQLLKAEGPYTSPTFVIMKVYGLLNSKFKRIYHFDCYRIGHQDILELGWEEIIADSKNLVLVEWPEKIERILPEKFIKLTFENIDENRRKIIISKE